ncbi:hypothetical protein D3C75_892280 [compost metagenome]
MIFINPVSRWNLGIEQRIDGNQFFKRTDGDNRGGFQMTVCVRFHEVRIFQQFLDVSKRNVTGHTSIEFQTDIKHHEFVVRVVVHTRLNLFGTGIGDALVTTAEDFTVDRHQRQAWVFGLHHFIDATNGWFVTAVEAGVTIERFKVADQPGTFCNAGCIIGHCKREVSTMDFFHGDKHVVANCERAFVQERLTIRVLDGVVFGKNDFVAHEFIPQYDHRPGSFPERPF